LGPPVVVIKAVAISTPQIMQHRAPAGAMVLFFCSTGRSHDDRYSYYTNPPSNATQHGKNDVEKQFGNGVRAV
jgi:hypothetical protein